MPGFYSIIVPVGDRRNLMTNPSWEIGTAGHAITSSGVVGSTSNTQAFGAWCGSIVPGANGTAGWQGPTWTAGNGTAYGWSFYGSFPVGSSFIVGIGDSSGNNLQTGTLVGTGGGSWHRYVGSYTESAGATRRISLRKNNSAVTTAFYIDAVQVEVGSVTTYIDGDQGVGYTWDGQPHASTSLRAASVRTGGSVYNLGDLGFTVLDAQGVGMPDVNVVVQDYGYLDGGFYQRTRANSRSFILTGLMSGTTWQDLHAIRQRVIDVIKPDLTPNPQPFRILYTGAGGSVQIDCVYDSGLTYGGWNGFAEQAAMRLIAPDPYWTTITEQGTSLTAFTNLGSANHVAYRDSLGRWGTLGAAGVTISGFTQNEAVRSLAFTNGTLFVGGRFMTAGGTRAPGVALYANNAWGTLTGGSVDNGGTPSILSIAINAAGTVVVGGEFTSTAGTTGARYVAQWTGVWGSLTGGTVDQNTTKVTFLPTGTLMVGGPFTSSGGTTGARYISQWTGVWGSLTGGTLSDSVSDITYGPDGALYVAGGFITAGGTTANGAARWGGAWGTLGSGINTAAGALSAFAFDNRGILYGGGQFGTIGGVVTPNIGAWNGAQWASLAQGIGSGTASMFVEAIITSPKIIVGGAFSYAGSVITPDALAQWTGGAWVPLDITLGAVGAGTLKIAAIVPDGTGGIYIGGFFFGTARAAVVTPIVLSNNSAQTPVRIRMRAPSSGTARVFQFNNQTNNNALFFNTVLQSGETLTIDTVAGSAAAVSSYRSNMISAIIPGSNIAKWNLGAGTNYISFFADNNAMQTDIFYRPRFWSNDDAP
jgi:hypothetical protein